MADASLPIAVETEALPAPPASRSLAATVPAGLVLAIMTTLGAFSYARLIFAGPLAEFTSLGFASAMITAVIVGLFVARLSSLPGTVAIPQDRVAPILALMAVETMRQLPVGTPSETGALLVLGGIALTTLLTGTGLLLLGRLRLGNLLRFIPYPVVGGFLAASGWLLLRGGAQMLTNGNPDASMHTWFGAAPSTAGWIGGVAVAVALAFVVRRRPRPMLVPTVLLLVVVGFYAVAATSGTPLAALREQGLVAAVMPPPWSVDFSALSIADAPWGVLLGRSGLVATVLFTTFISILLSSSAIELSTNQEADLNRELSVAGWGNLAAGACGGMVGFHSLSLSRFALSLGIPGRAPATISATLCVGLLAVGPALFGYLPNLVPGILLVLLGTTLLLEWVVDGARRLGRTDYAIVLLILVTVAAAGYLEGVAVGTVAAVILFIVKYSQVNVVNLVADGRRLRSNVERPAWHLEILDREGERTMVMRLRGFVFFGTAAQIIATIRERIRDPARPRVLLAVFDFQHVTGFDSSATAALTKSLSLAGKEGFRLALAGMSPRLRDELTAAGLPAGSDAVKAFADFDHALEWCEDALIGRFEGRDSGHQATLADQLRRSWPRPQDVDRLMPFLERVEFAAGDRLIRQGDLSDAVFFVESGHVTARIEHSSGKFTRLRRQGGGTMVGELGFYLRVARTASVVADSPGVAYRLCRAAMERIAQEDPALESSLHQFVVRILAARNAFINASLQHALE